MRAFHSHIITAAQIAVLDIAQSRTLYKHTSILEDHAWLPHHMHELFIDMTNSAARDNRLYSAIEGKLYDERKSNSINF